MDKGKVLIIGLVWPEPLSSAAGTRIIQLINLFLDTGYEVCFAAAASKGEYSDDLNRLGVKEQQIKLNDSTFNQFLQEIKPQIVMFDRYMVEEQYGWRVQQECPDALRILDTEDLHCLRHARQTALKSADTVKPADLFTDMAKREIASILRCDLSLIISEMEMEILQSQFRVDASLICYLPFLENEITEENRRSWKSFDEREGFVFIGNFLHEPNWDTVKTLKTEIWPLLRKQLPDAHLYIYGAYTTQKVTQLHNSKERFHVMGRAEDAKKAIEKHRILLAPIRFGAGVKGKFIDAMQSGTPAVTTAVGAEAMHGQLNWNGFIRDDTAAFIAASVKLYTDEDLWMKAQQNGIAIINERYGKSRFSSQFIEKLAILCLNLKIHRQHNFLGQILQHHTVNSSRYMSLWIEEKNKGNAPETS